MDKVVQAQNVEGNYGVGDGDGYGSGRMLEVVGLVVEALEFPAQAPVQVQAPVQAPVQAQRNCRGDAGPVFACCACITGLVFLIYKYGPES